jgi:hypothetical protein
MKVTFFLSKYKVEVNQIKSGMCQALVTDGTALLPIYLLFEPDRISFIEDRLKAVPFKESTTLDFFRMIVAGCIKTCMRY